MVSGPSALLNAERVIVSVCAPVWAVDQMIPAVPGQTLKRWHATVVLRVTVSENVSCYLFLIEMKPRASGPSARSSAADTEPVHVWSTVSLRKKNAVAVPVPK